MNQFQKLIQPILPKLEKEIEELLNRAGILGVEVIRQRQDSSNSYATRRLSNSTNYKVSDNNLTIGANAKSKGYSYGLVQEFGRPAGKGVSREGQEMLVKWIKRKMTLGHMEKIKIPRATKRTRKTLRERKENIYRGIAYLISKKIKANGQEGKFLYKEGFTTAFNYFVRNVNKTIEASFE